MPAEGQGVYVTRANRIYRGIAVWFFVVAVYFLWEAFAYRGLYAWLSEWQFDHFGWSLPILTFALLAAAFGVPALVVLRIKHSDADDIESPARADELIVTRAARLRSALLGLSGAFAFGAIISLVWTLTLPSFGAAPEQIVIGDTTRDSGHKSGPAHLDGRVDYTHTALFTQNLILIHRDIWFAPVLAERPGPPGARYFAELPTVPQTGKPDTRVGIPGTGILMRNGLPGAIRALYASAGISVRSPDYVLYASPLAVRWPFYIIAFQLAVAGLIAVLIAGFQHRYVRKRRSSAAMSSISA